jgi:hypothetical protein
VALIVFSVFCTFILQYLSSRVKVLRFCKKNDFIIEELKWRIFAFGPFNRFAKSRQQVVFSAIVKHENRRMELWFKSGHWLFGNLSEEFRVLFSNGKVFSDKKY